MMRSFITILALIVSLGASAQRFKGFTEPTAFVEELERYAGEMDKKAAFVKAFIELENRISIFINLPIESLDKHRLQQSLKEIGSSGK